MYSFTLVIKQYERKNPLLDDIRTIHSNNICLVAKNQKTGGLYIHKTGKIVKKSSLENLQKVLKEDFMQL